MLRYTDSQMIIAIQQYAANGGHSNGSEFTNMYHKGIARQMVADSLMDAHGRITDRAVEMAGMRRVSRGFSYLDEDGRIISARYAEMIAWSALESASTLLATEGGAAQALVETNRIEASLRAQAAVAGRNLGDLFGTEYDTIRMILRQQL